MRKIGLQEKTEYQIKSILVKSSVTLFRYAFLIGIGYIIIAQLAYMISLSVQSPSDLTDPSVVWLAKGPNLQNFKAAFGALDYMRAFFTTVAVQVLSGMIEVFTCALPAYGLARFKFKGKSILFFMVILMILLPPQMTAISMNLNFAYFDLFGILGGLGKLFGREFRPNLLDTGFVFWLPSVFGVGIRSGLFIFIYRQFFKGLPKELEEAASIDGANAFTTFMQVVVPSSGVAFLTVAIFSLVWHWNDYYNSILYFTDHFPLSVGLVQLDSGLYAASGVGSSSVAITMAACLLYMLPVLIVYIVLQRRFIASIDRVGIVG